MSHAAIVCREYGLPAVVGTGRATSQIHTGQTIRVDGIGRGGDAARRQAMTRRLHPPASGAAPLRRAAVRRQERDARRAAGGGDPGAARVRAVDRGLRGVHVGVRAGTGRRQRSAGVAPSDAGRGAPGGRGDRRRACAPRRCRTRSATRSPPLRRARRRRATGRGALQRGRRGQPEATFAGQQETLPVGARRRRRLRRACATAGPASTARRRSPTAPSSAAPADRRWA